MIARPPAMLAPPPAAPRGRAPGNVMVMCTHVVLCRHTQKCIARFGRRGFIRAPRGPLGARAAAGRSCVCPGPSPSLPPRRSPPRSRRSESSRPRGPPGGRGGMSRLLRALTRRRSDAAHAFDAATAGGNGAGGGGNNGGGGDGAAVGGGDGAASSERFLFQLTPAALEGAPVGVQRVAVSLYDSRGSLVQTVRHIR